MRGRDGTDREEATGGSEPAGAAGGGSERAPPGGRPDAGPNGGASGSGGEPPGASENGPPGAAAGSGDLRSGAPLAGLRRLLERLKDLAAAPSSEDTAHSVGEVVREADRLLRKVESTERVAVEEGAFETLRQLVEIEQQRYRDLSDFAPEAYLLTDALGLIREANRGACELFGVGRDDLRGRELEELVSERRRKELRRRTEEVREKGGTVRFQLAVTTGKGKAVPVDVVAGSAERSPRGGEAPVIRWGLSDATDRKRAERTEDVLRQVGADRIEAERVARENRLLAEVSRLLSSSPLQHREALDEMAGLVVEEDLADHCAVWLRESGRVRRVGSALTGMSVARLPAQFRSDYGLDGASVSGTIEKVLASDEVCVLCESEGVGGDVKRTVVRAGEGTAGVWRGFLGPLSTGTAAFGAVGVFELDVGPGFGRDDLEFFRELAERVALSVENARLYREAKRALRERSRTQRVVSHDLRNGLTNLTLAVDELRESVPEGEEGLDRNLGRIETSLDRIMALVNDLDPSVETGDRGRLQLASLDLRALVRDVLDTHEAAARRKSLGLAADVPGDLPPVVADAGRLHQVMDNLVQNAIKFTPPGGEIRLRVAADDERVDVSVLDTGPGVPDDDSGRIFERFWRGDDVGDMEGSGLGLAIVKTIVRAHGGEVRARNRAEGGAEIGFTLPLKADGGSGAAGPCDGEADGEEGTPPGRDERGDEA